MRANALRREVGFWGTAALSIGVMAPTLAMAVTGPEAAARLGRAAPLAYAFAALGVALVSYGFTRLAAEFAHAGSVYAFVGNTLGQRIGFLTGWALLGTYLVFPAVSITGIAIFGGAFLDSTGVIHQPDWFPLALVGLVTVGVLASLGIKPTTRSLLVFELVSVALIVGLMMVIYLRLATSHAPAGQHLTFDVFRLPDGVPWSTIGLAAAAGFLAFAGFESAGSLGEESTAPTRQIPRAIKIAVVFGGVFYVACMVAQSLGFGTTAAGVTRFAQAGATLPPPLDLLSRDYVGKWLGDTIDIGAAISAVGAGLGGVTVAARMMYAFARDGLVVRRLDDVSPTTGVPQVALTVELVITFVLLAVFRLAGQTTGQTFFYLAFLGVMSLLLMYVVTNIAAAVFLWRSRHRATIPIAIIGAAVAAYVLYRNTWPTPYTALPYILGAWLAIGALLTALPGFVTRVRVGLSRRTGHAPTVEVSG
jgi:amino acid transporter